jgi:hypothetical protein
MRRLLAILLIAAFGLPTAAPLLASGQDLEQSLPACCRRNGTHHCMMGGAMRTNAPAITAVCPSFPRQTVVAPHLKLTALLAAPELLKLPLATQSARTRAETQRRLSRERTRQTRGPPADSLL